MKYKIIITSGGTSEKIDNVRKITNSSSGKLGCTIANKLIELHEEEIDKIYYICSKKSVRPTHNKIEIIEIEDTNDLEVTVKKLLTNNVIHYFIHSMAVSDYTVDYVTTVESLALNIENNHSKNIVNLICSHSDNIQDNKISSNNDNLIIKLKKTPKIISMIKSISPRTYLVGFKLLDNVSEEELINTAVKLKDKNNCDLVIANDLNNIRNGNHKAFIIKTTNDYITAEGKEDIAEKLIKEMFKYKRINISNIDDILIDEVYKDLLKNKWHFVLLDVNGELYVLTKEKSIIKVENEQQFINSFEQDIYYKTIINNENISVNEDDLNIYKTYIDKYKDIMEKNIYGDKYIFGSVAVKTDKGFITTIRGKEDLNEYTVVNSVNHVKHIVNVSSKKATLNAPLLDYLFKNKRVKVIVHINHEYDDKLPYYDYAFPGTVRDSIRDNKTSFNIKNHGIIYLFDKNGNLI